MKSLVIEVSGLHLGFVGCYGNDWVATPNLERLAAEGIVFDQHIADSPQPGPGRGLPTQRSVGTGVYRFPDAPEALAEALADPAVRCETIDSLQGFAAAAIKRIEASRKENRSLLWIDGPDLAPPWRLPADLLTVYADEDAQDEPPLTEPALGRACLDLDALDRLQTTYAAVVTCFDAQLGRLLDHLREIGLFDRLLLCITARCGLPLAEHGMTGVARAWLHDELVHVPLMLRLPGAEEAGLRIGALTQPVDLRPTLNEFLGLDVSEGHGRSLLPLIRSEMDQIRLYAASGLRIGESEEWLLRTQDRALLLPIAVPAGDPPRRAQLYIKPDDRWEMNDLALREEEQARLLERTLREFVEATRRRGPLEYPALPVETAVAE
jgi:arylsulfatase A-like enzyme